MSLEQNHMEKEDSSDSDNGPDWIPVIVGGGIGYAIGGPLGGAAGAAIANWANSIQEEGSDHDQALAIAAKEIQNNASKTGSLYIAHGVKDDIVGSENTSPKGILSDIDGVPDILYTDVPGPKANLIVEVETKKAFKTQTSHILDQLEDYRTNGYKRVLAVPNSAVPEAEAFIEEHDIPGTPPVVVGCKNIGSVL